MDGSSPERITFTLPVEPPFWTETISIPVYLLNYGNHLDNAGVLQICHEVRVRWLNALGNFREDFLGENHRGWIMVDAVVQYLGEGFWGDLLVIDLWAKVISPVYLILIYRIRRRNRDREREVARVRTGMVGFDYALRKVTRFPPGFLEKLPREALTSSSSSSSSTSHIQAGRKC